MNPQNLNNIIKLNPEERYRYFIKKISDSEQCAGLLANDWIVGEDSGLLIWPNIEFAELYAQENSLDCTAVVVTLKDFLEHHIKNRLDDERVIEVFPTPSSKGYVLQSKLIASDIISELEEWYS